MKASIATAKVKASAVSAANEKQIICWTKD